MLHGIGDAIRDSAGKFIDKGLDLLRDALFLVFTVYYRRHQVKRLEHAEGIEARTSALESAVFNPDGTRRELLAETADGCAKGASAGSAVDIHINGHDSSVRPRHRKP